MCFLLFGLFPATVRAADECPTTKTENTGTYCAFNIGRSNLVHVWQPPNYDPSTAGVVVYHHGFTSSTQATWDTGGLSKAFLDSKVNALFVVPRGRGCSSGCNELSDQWSSLAQLLDAVTSKGITVPKGPVVIISFSGGYSSAAKTVKDPRVKGFIGFETLYGGEEPFAGWVKSGNDKRIILVSSSSSNSVGSSNENIKKLNRKIVESVEPHVLKVGAPNVLSAEETRMKGIFLEVSQGHSAEIPKAYIKDLLPMILKPSSGGSTSTPQQQGVPSNFELIKPVLNVPIPGLTFGDGSATDSTITVPFLSEYFEAIYKLLVGVSIAIAIVMLMIGGFQYTLGAASASQIEKAKERIKNAVIGLVLLFSAVMIVSVVNPQLSALNGVQLFYNSRNELDETDTFTANNAVSGNLSGTCSTIAECTTLCNQPKSSWPTTASGMPSQSDLQIIPNTTGLIGKITETKYASKETIDLLIKAGEIAVQKDPNYVLVIHSGYRNLTDQIQNACKKINEGAAGRIGKDVAWPGKSQHGVGYAVDVSLQKRAPNGSLTMLSTCCKTKIQNDLQWKVGASILSDIMTQAGFQRYSAEIWHFEPATRSASCRCKYPNCPVPARC